MKAKTIYQLQREALLEYYKEQGLGGTELYRTVVESLEKHRKRIFTGAKYGMHRHNKALGRRRYSS